MKKESFPLLIQKITEGIQEKKGQRIVVMDMRKLETQPCAFFVLAEGTSSTHVHAIADEVEHYVRKEIREKPTNVVGHEHAAWIAMDYGEAIVHIFQREARDFYALEQLWADGEIINLEE